MVIETDVNASNNVDAHYLLKSLQASENKGITAYAISIQNKPMYETTTHPTARFTPQAEAQVGKVLRALMASKGWNNTKLIGFCCSLYAYFWA